ncbi:fructosamine kinase [Flavobacteriaceae bacterium (ex Bugula neritina AB1)]|nr:fructosamine kinase [Flavobacteriaceae bacterium (ex Bugula neritina AB1)]
MVPKIFITYLEKVLSEKIISITLLSGGDINEVYVLKTATRKVVLKLNSASTFPDMFKAEAYGLQCLRRSNTFTIPEVLAFDQYQDITFLMLEYIEDGVQVKDFWSFFGKQLAGLHRTSTTYFGLDSDNYIGSLTQYNSKCETASEFYITQRLEPQFKLAIEQGVSFPDLDHFYTVIENEIPKEPSSLIHGDLWSGNFMKDVRGMPCLIDPAIAYAPRELDIGMMHLFGGFDSTLFYSYNEVFPLYDNWKERLPIWQLYYLLVHLNLFGGAYCQEVNRIIKKYV